MCAKDNNSTLDYSSLACNSSTAGYEHNFDIFYKASTQQVPYDFQSIMHYGSYCYSSNGKPTLLQRVHSEDRVEFVKVKTVKLPSDYDYLHLNLLYCEGRHAGKTLINATSF